MRVTINYIEMNLQEGDEVEIERHECGRCETTHTEVTVTRGRKTVAHCGDYVKYKLREDEIFGDVIEPHTIP